jgi:hypothetical protein
MWEPRRLTTLWAFTACDRDSVISTSAVAVRCSLKPVFFVVLSLSFFFFFVLFCFVNRLVLSLVSVVYEVTWLARQRDTQHIGIPLSIDTAALARPEAFPPASV